MLTELQERIEREKPVKVNKGADSSKKNAAKKEVKKNFCFR